MYADKYFSLKHTKKNIAVILQLPCYEDIVKLMESNRSISDVRYIVYFLRIMRLNCIAN